ncbi:galactokinase [Hathewaya limosa]|uniref:Galactokinase n=1 Tax=Hathewaya limosa TaxID=1536 RepID=A0ABU0JQN6_HATLI|nr:galactokinase [Hathewaya limosa]MDQ0478359.1 galactokinase [Hathewaya limosa]
MECNELKEKFIEVYGNNSTDEIQYFHSPGRVNLIGEHIDYNGGLVFPCALDFGTYALVRKRNDSKVKLSSTNFKLQIEVDINSIEYKQEDDWANYPKGVIKVIMDKGYKASGMDILISGDIPNGAGLSSSASLEVLIAHIVNVLFNNGKINMIDLVKFSQKAENKFVGVNCGIMDQFAVGMGKKNKAILLNCNTLDYMYADIDLKEYTLVLMNTNKRRALNESKYNERRSECDKALDIIIKEKNISNLCELSKKDFQQYETLLKDEVLRRRVKHVVFENIRVKKAFEALNNGNLREFGNLLIESHNSLKELYEVTGKELDTIVYEALKIEGCIGARMTGAGFGGCAIALVKKTELDKFKEEVSREYKKVIGYEPSFYFSGIGEGTRKLS